MFTSGWRRADLFAGLPCRLANYPVSFDGAERLRNLGRYTFADAASYRLGNSQSVFFRPVALGGGAIHRPNGRRR